MLILVLFLVLKDSLRSFSSPCPCPGPWGSGPCPYPCPWGVGSRRSLSLSWSLGVRSLSLSWSLWSSPCPCPCLWSLQGLVSIIPLFRFIRIIYYIVLSTHTISFNY